MRIAVLLLAVVLPQPAALALPAGDPARGESLYETRCIGCHALDDNRVGPRHRGVFGRRAGSVPDFDYSAAVKRSRIVWNERTLERWLSNPEQLIPGQKMGYQVAQPQDRTDLIAYLKRESGQ
jgi:cytochrome c